jgi:DNA polymerase III subunit epsilon
MKFAAIDFETANRKFNSACAVGIVRVENGQTIDTMYTLIRPPSSNFEFTYIHGITWQDVCRSPSFQDIWTQIKQTIAGVDFLVAHHARFDRRVLLSLCRDNNTDVEYIESMPFVCTVKIARKVLGISPANLSNVCKSLRLELNHHHALSDAVACSQIILKSQAIIGEYILDYESF